MHATDELTTAQAARLLGMSPRTLDNWRSKKKGPPYIKRPKQIRYLRGDVVAYREDMSERINPRGF